VFLSDQYLIGIRKKSRINKFSDESLTYRESFIKCPFIISYILPFRSQFGIVNTRRRFIESKLNTFLNVVLFIVNIRINLIFCAKVLIIEMKYY